MNYILTRLDELLSDIRAAVAGSDLTGKDQVTVTDDGRDVTIASSLRAGAIVVYPMPEETWPAPRTARLSWTIGVVASGDTPRAAAERIHALKDLLLQARVVTFEDRAAHTDFTLPDQATVPGYAITHTEEHRRPQ